MRKWHRYISIIFLLPLLLTTITGLLLIQRSNLNFMMPAKKSISGPIGELQSINDVIAKLESMKIDTNQISSIIYKPKLKQFIVRSKDYREWHFRADTLQLLNSGSRFTTLLIQLHEGSYFGKYAKEILFFLSGIALLFLCISGFYLWITPIMKRRKVARGKS
jgi:uncharacterized iron-regulated membrane protein